MTSIIDSQRLNHIIEAALTMARYHDYSDEAAELYLIFTSDGLLLSEDLDKPQNAKKITNNTHQTGRSLSGADHDLDFYLQQLRDHAEKTYQLELPLSQSLFRFKRASWRGLIIDEEVISHLSQSSSLGNIYCVIRLIRVNTIALDQETEQRIQSILSTDDDILVWVEDHIGLVTVTDWLRQSPRLVDYKLSRPHRSLPSGWRWLCVESLESNKSRAHWSNSNILVKRVFNIEERLSHENSWRETEDRFKWLLTFNKRGVIGYSMQGRCKWHRLDLLSTTEWMERTHLSSINTVQSTNEPVDSPQLRHVTNETPSLIKQAESPQSDIALIIDYEEVLSGLGSESSTIQVPTQLYSESSTEEIESNRKFEENQVEAESHIDLNTITDSLLDDGDLSAVLDISLSELPIQMTEGDHHEKTGEFEDPAFRIVKDILKGGNSLEVNRLITTLGPSQDSNSLVTHGLDELDQLADDSFVYNTINHRKGDNNEVIADFPTYNERLQEIEDFSVEGDLESLPTRIDLNTEQVLGALERERSSSVTRIVTEGEKPSSSENTLERSLRDPSPTSIENRSLQPQLDNDHTQDRAEALSREHTAKLRVRDFEMLTDIKDLPAVVPPSDSTPTINETSRTRKIEQSISPSNAQAPIIPPPPPSAQTIPFHNHIPSEGPRNLGIAQSAKLSHQEPTTAKGKNHKDRRSFSDVIRSLTTKNKG